MTKLEAEALEALVDSKFTEVVGENCFVSLTLTNKLRIGFGEDSICLNRDGSGVSWIEFTGFYSDLQDVVQKSLACMNENKEAIDKLIWSYDHRSELKED